ncbi:hypothetical protein A2U01_0081742, partial [Trifolium medium]|nr:hypothetical protein [Trifolium medium]
STHTAAPVAHRQEKGLGSFEEKGSPFREALIRGKSQAAGVVSEEHVLQVDVDRTVLEELHRSFVGVLALEVDVSRIRTTLYMEGRQHIS